MAKKGEHIAALKGEQRHKMRKALKKLRYILEFFGSLYPQSAVTPFVTKLKKLQDVFGYVNDVVTANQIESIAERHCTNDPPGQRAAGYVVGWHSSQAAICWTSAEKGWTRLAKGRRFWE